MACKLSAFGIMVVTTMWHLYMQGTSAPHLHLQQIQLHIQELRERVKAATVKTPHSARGAGSSKHIGFAMPEGGLFNSASGNLPSARTGSAVPILPGATNSFN